ncbi:MAG: hypothetical protein KDE29_12225 [Anaerolineales bacterium]|nr:hypothetical protein [Anaerolineales bacterium]
MGHVPAGGDGAGEGDEGQAGVVEEELACLPAGANYQVKQAAHPMVGHDLVGDVLHGDGG